VKTTFLIPIIAAIFAGSWSLPSSATQMSTYRSNSQEATLAKTGDFGLGIKWGTLTGVSGKYWANEVQAWEATVAFENGNTALGLDYLWHFRSGVAEITNMKSASNFVPYLGVGLISAFGSNTKFFNRNTESFGLAARLPVGLEFLPRGISLGVFAEMGLGFGFVPTTYTFITTDLGARYYF
jgi:hypothetical protein